MKTFNIIQFTDTSKPKVTGVLHSALRPSLFSHVPPYIRFSSHDIKGY